MRVTYCVNCDAPATTTLDIGVYRLHLCSECAEWACDDAEEADRLLNRFLQEVRDAE